MKAAQLHSDTSTIRSLDLESYLREMRALVDAQLESYLPEPREKVEAAAAYSLFLASKRIRPLFCLEICFALSGNESAAWPAACALEMVHTYSLIHDDLPSMDNDDLRRGKPTNHKVHGEAMAILAGDGLLTQAFEVLATSKHTPDSLSLRWVRELARAAGMRGMVLGQAIDLEGLGSGGLKEMENLHLCKTGSLLAASVVMGAMAAGCSEKDLKMLRGFGQAMGLAFQIQDDLLDVLGGTEIGKPAKSDEKNDKLTYVSLLGLERAKEEGRIWFERALEKLNAVSFSHINRLEDLTRFVIERKF